MRGARLLTASLSAPWRSIATTAELPFIEGLASVAKASAANSGHSSSSGACHSSNPQPGTSRPTCSAHPAVETAPPPPQLTQASSMAWGMHATLVQPTAPLLAVTQPQAPLPPRSGPSRSYAAATTSSLPPSSTPTRISVQVDSTPVQFEAGSMALQTSGSCLASSGSTHVLSTVTCGPADEAGSADADGLPLQVDYTEGAYARGEIPELKRRDRIEDEHVLCARAIDRSIRPLFPPGLRQEIHVCARVLSAGGPMDPEVLAINAASAALMCSDIPWAGPVGAVCIVRVDGVFKVGSSEPPQQGAGPAWALEAERADSSSSSSSSSSSAPAASQPLRHEFKLLFAGTKDKVMMVELEADQVTEEELREALALAQQQVAELVQGQLQLAAEAGKAKRKVKLLGSSQAMEQQVMSEAKPLLMEVFHNQSLDKEGRSMAVLHVKDEVQSALEARGLLLEADAAAQFPHAFETVLSDCMRQLVLDAGRRVDGRGLDEIRPLACDALPLQPSKVHGSALFSRGETQALCLATVGEEHPNNPWQELLQAQQEEDATRALAAGAAAACRARAPLLLHYEFPPYCVNETGKINPMPSRREVGHGALALKGLQSTMPDYEDFAFLVRLVAMTLGSNGSSSMAAVCGGSMALHMAGVPVRELVAGISVGLVSEQWMRPRAGTAGGAAATAAGSAAALDEGYGRQALLLDIQGMEDALGDMDFKVAGTRNGITALQLDTKLPGLGIEVLFEAVGLARKGHSQLLDEMQAAVESGRQRRPAGAVPQHAVHHIAEDLVEQLIGVGGAAIGALRARSGAAVAVRPGGEVQVYAPSASSLALALQGVRALDGSDLDVGACYAARVHELFDYGAVLEMASGAQHLLPISEVSHAKVRDIRDVLFEGQVLRVKCLGRDNKGLLHLSYKALQPLPHEPAAPAPQAVAGKLGRHHPSAHAADAAGLERQGDGGGQGRQGQGQQREQARQASGDGGGASRPGQQGKEQSKQASGDGSGPGQGRPGQQGKEQQSK